MEKKSINKADLEKLKSKISFGIKIWLEIQNKESKNILGSGWAELLEHIKSENNEGSKSLTHAAQECGYSYKYAWSILKRIENRTGMSPVDTSKGGRGGGGWVKLNEWGNFLLTTFNKLHSELEILEKKLEKTLKIQ